MSIQNKRIKHLTNAILKENLQEGILPDSREFIWQLNASLRDLNNDKSSFVFKPYRNTEILRSKKINEDNTRIRNDFRVLYDNSNHIENLLNREYQYFLTKKKRLEKELDIEENRLKEYVQNNQRGGFLPYAYDTFDTTEKVNLTKTSDLFVNTNTNNAHIVEEKNTSRRIFPNSDITFSFKPENIEYKEINIEGNISNILNDSEDLVWQKQIMLRDNREVTGTLEVNFDDTQLINYIDLSILTVKPVFLSIHFTPDNETWYNLPYYEKPIEMEKELGIDFPEMEIKALRFVVEKSEYDESAPEVDNFNYQYLFGFESIAFYNKSYPTKGVLYSNKLELENKPNNYLIDTVQLYADEWVPTGTEIQYEVALPSDTPDWQPIDPMNRLHPNRPQKVFFHNLRRNIKNEMYFPEDLSVKQSEAEDLIKNGIPLYKLSHQFGDKSQYHLPPLDVLEGSLKLYVGKNAAEVISLPGDNQELSVQDFLTVSENKEHYYQDLTSIDSGDIFLNKRDTEHKKYLVRIGLFVEDARSVSAAPVTTEDLIIYLNGQEILKADAGAQEEANYTFRTGWNEIVVLIDGKNANSVNGITTSLGFNFFNITEDIYSSSKPLKEVSVFELQNNVKLHDRTVFARREVENGIEILTNFAQKGLKFDLYFDYKEDFKEEDGILFRATLRRENGDNVPTPIIRKYRLEFS